LAELGPAGHQAPRGDAMKDFTINSEATIRFEKENINHIIIASPDTKEC
jgi:hypothetical protein